MKAAASSRFSAVGLPWIWAVNAPPDYDSEVHAEPRYVAVLEPSDRYMVFDTLAQVPCEIANVVLIGLSQADAALLCHLLNSGRMPSAAFLKALAASRHPLGF